MTFTSTRGRIQPPTLDDRTWQDLVDEMLALKNAYAPGWTDDSPSDIGRTLIELFAWLVEGVIYRLDQVPDKHYLAFLDLLGITRHPTNPARTDLTFTAGVAKTVPAGTQARTRAREGEPSVAFETDEDVDVLPIALANAVLIGPHPVAATTSRYADASTALVGPPTSKYLVSVPAGQAAQLCLGFDRATDEEVVLRPRFYLPVRDPANVSVTWTYSRRGTEPLVWPEVPGGADATESLQHDGDVRLRPPADWAGQCPTPPPSRPDAPAWTTVTALDPGGVVTDERFWIGLRIANRATTPLAVGLDRVLFNAALARTALTTRSPEALGESTGAPFQTFALRNHPLFRRGDPDSPFADLVVRVSQGVPSSWQTWTPVDDLEQASADAPREVYRVDAGAGEILFGNHDERTGKGHGRIPPAGSRIQAFRYRYVDAGTSGNVTPGQVTEIGTTPDGALPTGIRVTNQGPGLDGSDEEPVEDALRRAPEQLKIRDRAVTTDDYAFLAADAAGEVRISCCLAPRAHDADGPGNPPAWHEGDPWMFAGIPRMPGTVNVIVVPDQGISVPAPEPTNDTIRAVRANLDRHRDLTAQLEVWGPRYLPIIVRVQVVIWRTAVAAGATQAAVEDETLRNIQTFLHPVHGGPTGQGWRVGQHVFNSDLFKAIMPPEDLGYIAVLETRPDLPAYHFPPIRPDGTRDNYVPTERPYALSNFAASVRLADYELVCAASKHEVQAAPEGIDLS